MPLTVITLKNSSPSLRGDLSKWMQEIATGVYIGNFNSRIREKLWERVKQNVGKGEATLSYASRNEIGYNFETYNTQQKVIDVEGIPLVFFPKNDNEKECLNLGYSDAAKFRKAKRFQKPKNIKVSLKQTYVVIDIETEGLDENKHQIIELAAIRVENKQVSFYSTLLRNNQPLDDTIINLTGITNEMLENDGVNFDRGVKEFYEFIGKDILVGYNINFDLAFLRKAFDTLQFPTITNQIYDIKSFVKKEKMFLKNYKLETVLNDYGISKKVPHRALDDAKLIYELSTKVNKFYENVILK